MSGKTVLPPSDALWGEGGERTPFERAALSKEAAPSGRESAPSFHIGGVPVYGDVLLSPMEGYSDLPFRLLCRQFGSAMSYTEFINALGLLENFEREAPKFRYAPGERPVVFQIFDHDPRRLLEAALRLQEFAPDIIDLNMGCPAKAVAGRGAGSGLLRTPLRVARILRLLTRHLEVPVTAKMRLGWDESCRNYLLIARIVEESGGAALAVHGRTRAQRYGGQADWEAIAEIRQALSIPVIGNGDVRRPADAARMKACTGCAAVMIGRGAIGNPWIFAGLEREQVPPAEVHATMLRHLGLMLAFYGPKWGLIRFRKHVVRYLAPYDLPRERRRRLLTAEQADDFRRALDAFFAAQARVPPSP